MVGNKHPKSIFTISNLTKFKGIIESIHKKNQTEFGGTLFYLLLIRKKTMVKMAKKCRFFKLKSMVSK